MVATAALVYVGRLSAATTAGGNGYEFTAITGCVVGDLLVDDPRIACVNFTGSTEAGLSIAATAAKHLTDYRFELGGNDPFIVFEDADMDLVVKEAEDQARNNRQCCTGSKRFLVRHSRKEEFVGRLSAERDKLVIGDPMDPAVNMGPMISERAAAQVEKQVELTVAQGAGSEGGIPVRADASAHTARPLEKWDAQGRVLWVRPHTPWPSDGEFAACRAADADCVRAGRRLWRHGAVSACPGVFRAGYDDGADLPGAVREARGKPGLAFEKRRRMSKDIRRRF